MFKLKKNNITLDQQYETRSEAETAILDLITAEAKKYQMPALRLKTQMMAGICSLMEESDGFTRSLRYMQMP